MMTVYSTNQCSKRVSCRWRNYFEIRFCCDRTQIVSVLCIVVCDSCVYTVRFTMDFSPNNNYSGNSLHAIEMCQDLISESNYVDSYRSPSQLGEYFARDIDAFYNVTNTTSYSQANQQQFIENKKNECQSLSPGNVPTNMWTNHLNCDVQQTTSTVQTAHPISCGKILFTVNITFSHWQYDQPL